MIIIMTKEITKFFDKLEDKVRYKLSRAPILYAFLGGVGIVLFWRGIWHTTDDLSVGVLKIDSILSIVAGSGLLLLTGVFVSAFIGSSLIMTGLSGEKKLAEKTKEEIDTEEDKIKKLQETIERVEKDVEKIELELENRN